MKKIISITILLFLSLSLFAQWQPFYGGGDTNINEMEMAGPYLYVSSIREDSALVRIDLRDNSKSVMYAPNGRPFSPYGWKKMAAIGSSLLYTDSDIIYSTQNYGNSWSKPSLLPETGMCFHAANNMFFIGGGRKLLLSKDMGSSFSELFYESYYFSVLNPIYYKDNSVFYCSDRGVVKQSLSGYNNFTVVNSTPNLLYSMGGIRDTLIGGARNAIYNSTDGGNSWKIVHQYYSSQQFVYQVTYKDGITCIASANNGLQISYDYGKTLVNINDGLPAGTGVFRFRFDDEHIYIATSNGIYRRNKTEFITRSISGYVFYDFNNNRIKDKNEIGIPDQLLYLKGQNRYIRTDYNGYYSASFKGDPDTIMLSSKNKTYAKPTFYPISIPNTVGNFPIYNPTQKDKGEIFIFPLSDFMGGTDTDLSIVVRNNTADTLKGETSIGIPDYLTIVSLQDTTATNIADSLIWNVSVPPFRSRNIRLKVSTASGASKINLTAYLKAFDTIVSVSHEEEADGAVKEYKKNVLPKGNIDLSFAREEKYLTYYIRFTRTDRYGNYSFIIHDTLSNLLDLSSFEFLGSSHNLYYSISSDRSISMNVSNVYSRQERLDTVANRHGYVAFRCRPVKDLEYGSSIINQATIDYQNKMLFNTNSVITNVLDTITSIPNLYFPELGNIPKIYPNPVQSTLFVEDVGDGFLKLYTVTGGQIGVEEIATGNGRYLNVEHLPEGLYFLQVVKNNNHELYKFLKKN